MEKEIEINPEYAYESFWDEEKYYWEEAIKGCHWKKIDDVMSAKREAFRSWLKKYNYILAQPNLKKKEKNPIIGDLKGDNKTLSERKNYEICQI